MGNALARRVAALKGRKPLVRWNRPLYVWGPGNDLDVGLAFLCVFSRPGGDACRMRSFNMIPGILLLIAATCAVLS